MATIKLQGNASGSGTVILTAPNTNSTRTITLPDQDVNFGTLGAGPPVVSTLNGTGTIALQNSTGVSSVTDNGTGKYQFNFSSNFSTATYYANGSYLTTIQISGNTSRVTIQGATKITLELHHNVRWVHMIPVM